MTNKVPTPEPAIESFFLRTTADAVSEKLTHCLHAELITLAQAEVLKNLLNNYYDFLIKEYIEND